VANENRTKTVRQPGLLVQLKEFQQHKDTDRERKAERGAPRVKTAGKPPGDLAGFFTLAEITCEAYTFIDRILTEAVRDRSVAALPIKDTLRGLPYQVSQFADTHPDLAHECAKATRRWLDKARRTLKLVTGDAMFAETVCGNCGVGALAIAADNSSEVRCVGTPAEPPCGETYGMGDWVGLYEQGRAS
jgi:hypothetical protein